MRSPPPPGRQVERTLLAWDRTTLGLLTTGALVLLHHAFPVHFGRIAVAAVTLLVAMACVLIRRRRGAALAPLRQPVTAPRIRPAAAAVLVLGGGVALLGAAVLTLVLVTG